MKTTKITGYHLKVEPRSLGNLGFVSVSDHRVSNDPARDYRKRVGEIADQIRRHVDNVGHIEIVEESESCCEFCGYHWGEKSDEYNGGCCDRDEEAHALRQAAEQAS